jgi:hypothetical protein
LKITALFLCRDREFAMAITQTISMSRDVFLEGVGNLALAMIGNEGFSPLKLDRPSAQLVHLIWSGKPIGTAAHQGEYAHFDPPVPNVGDQGALHIFGEWAGAALNRAMARR